MNKLIYVSSFGASVFESQVLSYLKALSERKVFDRIYLLLGVKGGVILDNLVLSDQKYISIRFLKFPAYKILALPQYISLKKALGCIDLNNSIIHIRSDEYAKYVQHFVKNQKINCKIITDIRGAVLEETLQYKGYSYLRKNMKKKYFIKQRESLKKNTDFVSVVSSRLKEYVSANYSIKENKIFINHSFASYYFQFREGYRKKYRKKLNIDDNEVVFIFSTRGDSSWQNTEEIISNISMLGHKIINLSKKKIDKKNVINLYVPHKEVVKYLCAADIGIIWRNNDIVNNVACPVKFSEYVSCGLPVIANSGVNIIASYIEETGFGKVVKSMSEIDSEMIREIKKIDRKKIECYSKEKFHSDGVVTGYIKMYKKMSSKFT